MRGRGDTAKQLLKRSDGQEQYNALTAPNYQGVNVYHLSLMSKRSDKDAQNAALYIIELIGGCRCRPTAAPL